MFEELKRPLAPEEIEVRVGLFKKGKGFSLLLYKNARTDARILDEWADKTGGTWSCKYRMDHNNNPVCAIILRGEFGTIVREDVGFNDREGDVGAKGAYSDAFKRAGFKFGIGVELYETPFIWVPYTEDRLPYTQNWRVEFNEKSLRGGFKIMDEKKQIWPPQAEEKRPTNEKFVKECMKLGYSISKLNDIAGLHGFASITQVHDRKLQAEIYNTLKAQKEEEFL